MGKRSRKSLAEYATYHWIGLIGALAGVVGLILAMEPAGKWIFGAGAAALALCILWIESKRRWLSQFASGVQEFIPAFPEHRNAEVLEEVESSYAYLGVSFDTVANSLCNWIENRPHTGNVKIRLLLTDPEYAPAWKGQATYERKGQAKREELDTISAEWRDALGLTLRKLADALKGVDVEVRYHREVLHEFIHMVDDEELYIGLLRRGVSNRECPVVVLKKKGDTSLFSHYSSWFEFLWEESANRSVDLTALRGRARGAQTW